MALKTNYKDDVPDESVNVNRKFNMIDNGDGTVSFEDATEYEQVGDNFGALDVNAITKALTDETANVSFQFGIDGNGDYGYIKEGETAVTPFKTRHTETYKPTSRAANLDMGLYHKKRYVDTTSVPNTNSGTYKPTQRKNNNDMGATNTYRYVDTTSVPNTNSQTYSVTSNGTKDMGETNIYRYLSVAVDTHALSGAQLLGTSSGSYAYDSNSVYIICANGGGYTCATDVVFRGGFLLQEAPASLTSVAISGNTMTISGSANWRRIYRVY